MNMALLRKHISIIFLGKIPMHKTFLLVSFNVGINVLYLCSSSSGFVSVSYSSTFISMVHIKPLSSFTSMFLTTFSISEIEAPEILILFLFREFRRTNSLFIFLIIDVPTTMVSFSDSSTSSTENGFEMGICKLVVGFGLVPFLTRDKPFGSRDLSAPLPNETFLVKVGLVLLLSRWKSVGFSDLSSLFPGLWLLSIVVPKVMYGSEAWSLNAKERSDLEVFEMKGLRSMCGVSKRGRVRNVRIRERCG